MNPSALKGIFEVFGKQPLAYFDRWIMPMLKNNKAATTYCAETFIYKTIYYGGTADVLAQLEGFHTAISGVLVGASFVPGPVGMVACFLDGLLYTLTGDFMAAGVAFLGMIPGIKQLGLFAKFIKAFQKCPVIARIFGSWTNVTRFFDKIAKNMGKINISAEDVTQVCGTLTKKVSPNLTRSGQQLGSKLKSFTSSACMEGQKEIMSYAGKNVVSGHRLLSVTLGVRI